MDDTRRLLEALVAQRWKVELTGKTHWRAKSPDGVTIVHFGGTPSDRRWLENAVRDLRRGGFDGAAFKGRKKQKGGR